MQLACPHCAATNRIPDERVADRPLCGKCGKPLLAGKPVVLDEQNFDAVAGSGLLVMVDFWAAWCAPCRMMAPQFAAAAEQLGTDAVLAKVDTEANPTLAGRFAIRSIPTLLLIRGGRELAREAGARPVADIVAMARLANTA